MATYLLTWNPNNWDWYDLIEDISKIETLGSYIVRWSIGTNWQNIKIGDRVFLMCLGKSPKGIIGSGQVETNPFPDKHWDSSKSDDARYIEAKFDILLHPDYQIIMSEKMLQHRVIDLHNYWTPQASGKLIDKRIAKRLETEWAKFLSNFGYISEIWHEEEIEVDELEQTTLYKEGKARLVTSKTYERSRQAREKCLQEHGYQCCICEFDFEATYGELGKEYIHVHHIKPLSEIDEKYEVNPVKDLVPVCPNCHAMIHRGGVTRDIEEIKTLLKK